MLHQRECIVWWIVLAVVVSEVCLAQETELVSVVRDPKGDMVRLTREDGVCVNGRCPPEAPTYLVGEELPCVDKVEALGDCNIQLVPRLANTFSTDSIQSFIAENGSLMVLDSATNQYGVGRLFSLQGTRQRGSNCRVTGLTLLRGNRVLSHQGFSVTSGREITIVVHEEHLAYPKEDYDGEVFLMNISCSDNSQVNCVVFKLKGTTDLTEGKFYKSHQNLTITNYCVAPATTPITTPTTANSGHKNNSESDVPILRYWIAGSLCGVGLVFCAIITVCTAWCYFSHKRKSANPTTRQSWIINRNCREGQDVPERREVEEVDGEKCTVQANPAYWKHSRAQSHQQASVRGCDSSSVAYLYEDVPNI